MLDQSCLPIQHAEEDGEGGGKGWLGSQRCQIGGAQASVEWIWCQRAGGRSSSLLSPQGAYWYMNVFLKPV